MTVLLISNREYQPYQTPKFQCLHGLDNSHVKQLVGVALKARNPQ